MQFSVQYPEVSAYYVYSLVYLCRSLLEQKIELTLVLFIFSVINSFSTVYMNLTTQNTCVYNGGISNIYVIHEK